MYILSFNLFFFFNDTATTEIYTLSLHDALPIFRRLREALRDRVDVRRDERDGVRHCRQRPARDGHLLAQPEHERGGRDEDRKSTRLNSSHSQISYAVFCLKKKNTSCLHRQDISS